MAFHIADSEVENLARELQRLLRTRTLKEAVRTALRHELERTRKIAPFEERIRKCQQEYAALETDNPDINLKDFFDQMWASDSHH